MSKLPSLNEVETIISQVKERLGNLEVAGKIMKDMADDEVSVLELSEYDRDIVKYHRELSSVTVMDKDLETDRDYIEKSVEVVISVLNVYYHKHQEGLVADEHYDKLRDDFLAEIASDNKVLEDVGESMSEDEEKFFQYSVHGFYNTEDELVEKTVNGSMSKKTRKDFLTAEQEQALLEGEEVEPDFSSMKDFNGVDLVVSDKMDGITLVASYTSDKAKGLNHVEKIYKHQVKYIEESSKSEKEKQKILGYLKKRRNEIVENIKNVKDGNHFLYKIVTRGDGDVGEDITFNAMKAQGFVFELTPDQLSEYKDIENYDVVIRGEAVITREDFKTVPYKNPRNGVALIRNQEGDYIETVSWIPFEKIAYDFESGEVIYSNRAEMFDFFKENGFKYPQYTKVKSFKEAYEATQKRFEERAENENFVKMADGKQVWTDGMIISIDDSETRVGLGMVGKKPKGELAFKPIPERGLAIVESIEFTVGKTGMVTPVIHFKDKVLISGSEVQKVTGANEEIMKELAPYKGAVLEVVKRGEIIPKAEKNQSMEPLISKVEDFCINQLTKLLTEEERLRVLEDYHEGNIGKFFNKSLNSKLGKTLQETFALMVGKKRVKELLENKEFEVSLTELMSKMEANKDLFQKANEFMLVYPSECPSCGSSLQKGKVLIKCINKGCEGKTLARLVNFTQKLTKGIGEGKVNQLYKNGKLNTYADFFKVDMVDFKDESGNWIEGWKDTSAEKFIESVNRIRVSKDNVFFGSLFFDGIGEGRFLKLFQDTSLEELLPQLNEMTESIPEGLFTEKDNIKKAIKKLEDSGYKEIEVFKKITSIKDFGHITAETIINTWVEEKEAVNALLSEIKIEPTKVLDKSVERGTFLLTGTFEYLPDEIKNTGSGSLRKILTNYLKDRGYTVSSSVSSKTDCVVMGEGATMHKVEKAKSMGIPVYTDKEFFEHYNVMGEDTEKKEVKGRHP